MKFSFAFFLFSICFFSSSSLKSQTKTDDSLALVDLYNSTNGPGWTDHTNWLTANPLSTWSGIALDFNSGRVNFINLYQNNLSGSLPSSFGNLTAVTILGLEYNNITGIPNSFGNLANLTRIHLEFNSNLKSLPDSFGTHLTKVNELHLEGDSIMNFPASMLNMISLTGLYLGGNKLTSLPDSFGVFKNMVELDLQNNNLSALPSSFGKQKHLYNLYLSYNQLQNLPASFQNLSALTNLTLDHNRFKVFPVSLSGLSALYTLDISDNYITRIPPVSLVGLSGLRSLVLSSNLLTDLPSTIGDLKIINLYLSNNKIDSLPYSLKNMTALSTFDLSSNNLTAVPFSVGNIISLSQLILNHNSLTDLPVTIKNLTALRYLDLSYNNFTDVPFSIRNLDLYTLIITQNKLTGKLPNAYQKRNLPHVLPYDEHYYFDGNYLNFDAGEYLMGGRNPRWQILSFNPQALIHVHANGNALSVYAGGTLSNNTYTWYQVGNSTGTAISGDSTFTPASPGSYYTVVTNAVAKMLTLTSDTITVSGFAGKQNARSAKSNSDLLMQNSFSVYPTPSKDIVHINLSSMKNEVSVLQIINTDGKLMTEKNISETKSIDVSFNISSYAKGFYFIIVKTKDETLSKKFIKE